MDSTCELERIDLHEVSNESSRRVAVGLLLQYMRDLSQLMIPIPPLKEQERIVVEVAKWISLIDTIKNRA